ncbi:MAG: hypothetical protein QNJ16_20195 [Rhodobacter sp.]|nr:hypothetical protein [Rhodobacter sp.]
MEPTIVTWLLIAFGVLTHGILTYIYSVFARDPHSKASKDLMIGEGKDWRDETHFDLNLGFAWTDFLFFVPLFVLSSIGMVLGKPWGYVLFGAAGACSLYINIILLWVEKKHVYAALGPLRYYTYFWGFFVYWGALALVYSMLRVSGLDF